MFVYGGNAGYHGAITCWVQVTCFNDCLFTENYSWGSGGGAGAVWAERSAFTDCQFVSNRTQKSGGALYLDGGECMLMRCVYRGNIDLDRRRTITPVPEL